MKLIQFNSAFTHLAKQAADRTLCGRPITNEANQVPGSLREALDICDKCSSVELQEKETNG